MDALGLAAQQARGALEAGMRRMKSGSMGEMPSTRIKPGRSAASARGKYRHVGEDAPLRMELREVPM